MYGVEGILLGAFVGDTVGCMDGKKVGGGVPGLGGQGAASPRQGRDGHRPHDLLLLLLPLSYHYCRPRRQLTETETDKGEKIHNREVV